MLNEYIKFDKYAITLFVMVLVFGIIYGWYFAQKAEKRKNVRMISALFVLFFEVAIVIFNDMRIIGICIVAFAALLLVCGAYYTDTKMVFLLITSALISSSGVLFGVAAYLSNKYLGAMTLQGVSSCVAMGIGKAENVMLILIISILISILAYFIYVMFTDESVGVIAYLYLYLLAMVWNVYARLLPDFNGNLATKVTMYGSFVVIVVSSVAMILEKNSHRALGWMPMMFTGLIGFIMSTGYNLTACMGLQLVIQIGGLLGVIIANYMTGRKMYTNIVCMTGIALSPIVDFALKLSIFKSLVEIVEMQWNMMMGMSIIIIEIALGKWILNIRNIKAKGALVVSGLMFFICLVIGLTPVITQHWIYPIMSQTELMIANISQTEILTSDILICAGFVLLMTGFPIIPIARANK